MDNVAGLAEAQSWSPPEKDILTLQQLGVPKKAINDQLVRYREVCPYPSAVDFQRFVLSRTQKTPPRLQISWRPGEGVFRVLEGEGYQRTLIEHAVAEFVIWNRERNAIVVHTEAAFMGFIRRRYSMIRRGPLSPAAKEYLLLQGANAYSIKAGLNTLESTTGRSATDYPERELIVLLEALIR